MREDLTCKLTRSQRTHAAILWHQQLLVQNVVFHLYLGPIAAPCRAVCVRQPTAHLLVKIYSSQNHLETLKKNSAPRAVPGVPIG